MEDQSFSAHRIVLAATIPYFYAMFTHDMAESRVKEITMKEIDPQYVHVALYTHDFEHAHSILTLSFLFAHIDQHKIDSFFVILFSEHSKVSSILLTAVL